MKTSLDHLPAGKRRELTRVVEIIRENYGDSLLNPRFPTAPSHA
jgi:hypothetical protein